MVTKGVDRCLFAFTAAQWEEFKANIKANADLSARGRQLSRMFFSMAFEATLDRQGRVLIPAKLAQYAGLRRDVTITGVDDRLEIWDTEEWNRYVTGRTSRSRRSWKNLRGGISEGDGDRAPSRDA